MSDARLGSLATVWARDAAVIATIHRPADDPRAWSRYLDGLTDVYTSRGIGQIVDRSRIEADGCAVFWLLHDLDGACVAGLRVEGPFADVERYAGLAEMRDSPDVGVLSHDLGQAARSGLVEFKGIWSTPERSGLGTVLARCMQHSLWWLDLPHAFCTCAPHAQPAWESAGGRRLDHITPAVFPNETYRTAVLVWDADHRSHVDTEQNALIAAERRYLQPVRDRLTGMPESGLWHPELLLDGDPRLQELHDRGLRLVDRYSAYEAELNDLLPPVAERLRREPAHWVHLPWRKMVLRLPGPDTYWRLRTDRNRHKLLDEELGVLRRRAVGVVGLSVGSSAAFTLAQEGLCGELRLADYDCLEITNLNRLSASVVDLGTPKTHVAARRLAELDPYLAVSLYSEGVTGDNVDEFLDGLDVVVEECDSIDIKFLVRTKAAEAGVPLIMETSDRGLLDVERFDLQPDREPFHGLIGHVDAAQLEGLTTDDKVPYVLSILESDELSAPMAASMVEIDQTTRSWPQLASDVALGSCLVAASVRRLFTGSDVLRSGRTRLDLGDVLDALVDPEARSIPVPPPAPIEHDPLPDRFSDALVTAAGLAPSGGNMQPWRFEQSPTSFDVILAPRSEVGMDIGRRGSAVACGAALANAVAIAAVRSRLSDRMPSPDITLDLDRPDLVGRVHLGTGTDPEWADLAPYVTDRVSNRRLAPADVISPEVVETLQRAADAAGGRCHYVPTPHLGSLVDIWAEANRVRFLTPRLHREMMEELRRPGIDPLEDGLDERTLELSPIDAAKLPILRRADVMAQLERWDGGARLGDDTRTRLEQSSGLLVVSVNGRSRSDYVTGGIALQRIWLTATRLGLALQPMVPLFGYAHSAADLAELIRPDRAERLFDMGREAYDRLGFADGESFVLAARIHEGPRPTAISRRRPARLGSAPAPESSSGLSSGQFDPVS